MTGLPPDQRLLNNHSITNDASAIQPDLDLTKACSGERRRGLSSGKDASAIQPDLDLTTGCSGERRRGLSSEHDASILKPHGDWTASNSEASMELEVRYR